MLDRANHAVYHPKIQIAEVDMRILGFAILAVVFAGLFMITAGNDGYAKAAMAWGASIVTTGFIFLAVRLIIG